MSVQYANQAAADPDRSPDVLDGVPRELLIGGQWTRAVSGDTMEVVNPATEKPLPVRGRCRPTYYEIVRA